MIDPAEFEFLPGVPEALLRLRQAGYLLVVVSNQSGIGRGYFSVADVERLHQHMCHLLQADSIELAGIYFCPHHPSAAKGEYLLDCDCRKGRPGMLLQAAEELEIDLSSSYMVGDKESDLQAGNAAGCQSILVRTGYGEKSVRVAEYYGAAVVADLAAAADLILATKG